MFARRFTRWPLWCLCSLLVVFSVLPRGEARPNYKKFWDKLYGDVAKNNKTTCNLCHLSGTDDKKHRNHYGVALAKELGKPRVTDEEKIIEALKAIEDGECRSGKWKERLENGLPPCVCGRGDHETNSYIARQLSRDN